MAFDHIELNLKKIKDNLPSGVTLVAVSKTFPYEAVAAAYEAGQRDFGENKVQDLLAKAKEGKEKDVQIRWHFIGHLQSNKVKQLFSVPDLHSIHSLSSLKLAKEFIKHEARLEKKVEVYIQVNTSAEEEKSGVTTYEQLKEVTELIMTAKNIELCGLMTIGKIRTDDFEGDAIKSFELMNDYKSKLENDYSLKDLKLSMGMSSDYPLAIKHGATHIRIGTSIFGKR